MVIWAWLHGKHSVATRYVRQFQRLLEGKGKPRKLMLILSDLDDGSVIFLRNVELYPNYKTLQPRRPHSSRKLVLRDSQLKEPPDMYASFPAIKQYKGHLKLP
jgi:hypothetical protein